MKWMFRKLKLYKFGMFPSDTVICSYIVKCLLMSCITVKWRSCLFIFNDIFKAIEERFWGGPVLTVVSALKPNSRSDYKPYLESLGCGGYWREPHPVDSLVLLGDFNTHMGNDRETWLEECPPDLNLSDVGLLCSSWIIHSENHVQK